MVDTRVLALNLKQQLKIPQSAQEGGVSTGNVAPLLITFQNQTLQSKNDGAFSQFFAAVTDTSGVEFELKGTADVVSRTTIGDVPISGIPFNVSTSLKGMLLTIRALYGRFN